MIRRSIAAAALAMCLFPRPALAGFISDENAKAGVKDDWRPMIDGTSFTAGVSDMYPASWSIARGDSLRLKVRSTSDYSVHVFRIGWYDGAGAREITSRTGLPADPQPYPTSDPVTGIVQAKWHDSVSIATDSTWTPGLYVARLDRPDGKQAATFFVVRDDGLAPRPRILMVVTTGTHQAYNGWPGPDRGGKSLYGFNSSPSFPTGGLSQNQAVKVSFDRPYFVGFGLADLVNYEVPFVRWLERNGWDVAYCTDQEFASNPSLSSGRKVLTMSGHWEYVSRAAVDNMRNARDAGTNLLLLSGDTISYQVRFEDGGQTMVGYKESWPADPEELAAEAAQAAGDLTTAKAHYENVSRGWRNVGNPLGPGEPGMLLTGLHSGGAFGPSGPWGDLVIDAPDHWLFAGTGIAKGDRIHGVMGYEFDSAELGDPSWDAFRPANQVILGTIVRASTGEVRGNSGYYKAPSGAEVVAFGAVEFAWALDGIASSWKPEDARVSTMMTNALTRFTGGAPPPPPISVPPVSVSDAGPPPVADTAPPIADTAPPPVDSTTVVDTSVVDTSVVDTSVVDTSVVDTSVVDTTPPPVVVIDASPPPVVVLDATPIDSTPASTDAVSTPIDSEQPVDSAPVEPDAEQTPTPWSITGIPPVGLPVEDASVANDQTGENATTGAPGTANGGDDRTGCNVGHGRATPAWLGFLAIAYAIRRAKQRR